MNCNTGSTQGHRNHKLSTTALTLYAQVMMMAFGFCMYCLWKKELLTRHFPHYISAHNTPAHFDDLISCVSNYTSLYGYTQSHYLSVHSHDTQDDPWEVDQDHSLEVGPVHGEGDGLRAHGLP